jgi:5-methylcytosine-specific restriction endonuclease McrA
MKTLLLLLMLSGWGRSKDAVWQKGVPIPGMDSTEWRTDSSCYIIRYSYYGKREVYGWHIDHIKPRKRGGSDSLINLQPLYWKANLTKSAKYPYHVD